MNLTKQEMLKIIKIISKSATGSEYDNKENVTIRHFKIKYLSTTTLSLGIKKDRNGKERLIILASNGFGYFREYLYSTKLLKELYNLYLEIEKISKKCKYCKLSHSLDWF